ncbi:zinc ribbon domain-containing protein [Collinsella intestinalis]|uniref:zinc-ribbon domain-containing protein n=1 Tax=Collinsella intestinalis TaxID=147207 RepID=UPI00195C3029|nr:zinc ribbon domain-containing protein [Collinsella intestinalis]
MFCSACGAKVRDTDSFCWKCGARVGAPDDGEDNEPNDNVSVVQGKAGQIPPLIKARCNQAKPLNARVPRRQAAHPVPSLTMQARRLRKCLLGERSLSAPSLPWARTGP